MTCRHKWIFTGYWHAHCAYCPETKTHTEKPEKASRAMISMTHRAILPDDFKYDPGYFQNGTIHEMSMSIKE